MEALSELCSRGVAVVTSLVMLAVSPLMYLLGTIAVLFVVTLLLGMWSRWRVHTRTPVTKPPSQASVSTPARGAAAPDPTTPPHERGDRPARA